MCPRPNRHVCKIQLEPMCRSYHQLVGFIDIYVVNSCLSNKAARHKKSFTDIAIVEGDTNKAHDDVEEMGEGHKIETNGDNSF